MSNTTSPSESPVIQSMHNPSQAAIVQQPLAPVGNTKGAFHAPGQATKAMLAKRLAAKGANPKYISPTDKMLTPCTAKINQSKQKHFTNAKPVQLQIFKANSEDDKADEDEDDKNNNLAPEVNIVIDDGENPF
ncbi:hypothetical protein Clacol_001791 [Clathrus columnatus]|uniref:Uncharacterized protein n=1 Tax=Clathrus columnatus TaxID=1419009 RepID=A0AAV5A4L0_9AGAM|nr:hypothetical protein Clacol_001791 [Clathrus columnatus]